MKKFYGLILLALLLIIPLGVHAEVEEMFNSCTTGSDGSKTCSIGAVTDSTSIIVSLTEEGGATIDETSIVSTGSWIVSSVTKSGSTYTFTITGTDTGEVDLFKFSYKPSGETDCRVLIDLDGKTESVTPDTPKNEEKTPTGKCVYNKDGYFINGEAVTEEEYNNECPKTGVSLPFVAIGTIALLAGGAYVATKNKTKMYKI